MGAGKAKVKASKREKSSKGIKAAKGKGKEKEKKVGNATKAVKTNKATTSEKSKKDANVENVEADVVLEAVPAAVQVADASEVEAEAEVKSFVPNVEEEEDVMD